MGSRPLLAFDTVFDTESHFRLLKDIFVKVRYMMMLRARACVCVCVSLCARVCVYNIYMGSRSLLAFDPVFDTEPHIRL